MGAQELRGRDHALLILQREIGRLFAPLWIPIAVAIMRLGMGWRLEGVREVRKLYRGMRSSSTDGVLVCANHLTMVDSFVVAWALAPAWWYLLHFASVPWNVPERDNFARTWPMRALIYLMKCIPLRRGGDRGEVAKVLARVTWLLSRGETALIFPEGGRSRSGRVEAGASTYGVGRVVRGLPGLRVLCVYLRGDGQTSWTDAPARGDRFRVRAALVEPKSDHRGLRGSLEVSRQVLAKLAEMEREHFDGRR